MSPDANDRPTPPSTPPAGASAGRRALSPSARSMGSTMGDALALEARKKPKPPAAKFWVWLILFVAVGAVGLAQILGLTSSPVADKVKQRIEDDRKREQKAAAPDASMAETPAMTDGPPTPGR